ncbi:MAG: energy transducer TonB [Hymenobacter sp.]|nr:energy transducer TonB [Hymenobacter sp.]
MPKPLPLLGRLGAVALSLALAHPAVSQTAPPAEKVWTYVEQMPQLPGGGGNAAVLSFIQQHVTYPPRAERVRAEGRVFVAFTVAATGKVADVAVAKGFRPDCDSAAVEGVKQLPQFVPGRQTGVPVPVRFTVPVTFQLQPSQTPVYDSLKHVYYSVERLPVYQGKSLTGDFLREFKKTSAMASCTVPTFPVFVSLTVGPDGSISDVASENNLPLVSQAEAAAGKKGIIPEKRNLQKMPFSCEAALLIAAYRLAPFTPGTQSGRNVAVRFTIQLIGADK